ncbi:hypothetical protein OX459_00270 [Janthinobacterium sp. SUN026]|uniref:hypothetical protein n=1 Tax=Janthinobacterium sp. SUN026 TaxID=3002438 RepID=UPI0025B0F560|nr:hypothetical protein [Janthinobacterium sp. SUN026]MDN2669820.1 hypothetical protein [Janthinobacterium sp. SUN026]
MFSSTSFKASLSGRALRRSGWLILGMMIVLNALHWMRHGTLGWSDVRDSVCLLLIYLGIATLLEYKRQRDAEEAEDAR